MVDAAADEALLSRIEDASINASAPAQQRWLDGWILRYCPGKARRSRCINAVAAGRLPLPEKIDLARSLFREAGLPMVFRVTRYSEPAGLDAQLEALGWRQVDITCVQVLRLLEPKLPGELPAGLCWTELTGGDFAAAVGALRGSPEAQQLGHAARLAASPIPYRGFVIRRVSDNSVLACGQTAQEADLVGIYDVHTAEAARGQGLAKLLCERMLSLAVTAGARTAYLQVEAGNAPALRVYARLGFGAGYSYHYREDPAG